MNIKHLYPLTQGATGMDDRQFHRLLGHLGYSRDGYRRVRKGVKKRLRRHMRALGCQHLAGYLAAVEASPRVRSECLRRLSVPISRFMRDRAFWDDLAAKILPDLVRRFGTPLQAWSAGCACGEEAYSLAISARAAGAIAGGPPVRLDVLATDRNPAVLKRGREGVYQRSSCRELDARQLARYFTPLRGGRRHRVRPELQSNIDWLCCDIDTLPVKTAFHLVLLRNNLLTYLKRSAQTKALPPVLAHLRRGGVLVVGRGECLPVDAEGLVPRIALPFVYDRRG